MAIINLMETGFTVIPEGTYIFKVVEAEYKEAFGKVVLKLATKEGYKHQEQFTLKSNGKPNTGAIKAFSAYCRQILNNPTIQAVDPTELTGHFIKATITHDTVPSKNDPSKMMVFPHIDSYTMAPASGFTSTPEDNLKPADKTDLDF